MANQDQDGAVFITGATGSVGSEVLVRYRQHQPERRILILVRASDEGAPEDRRRQLLENLFGDEAHVHDPYVVAVAGDIELDRFGLERERWLELAEQVDEIVHAAASIEFDLGLADALRINVLGTEHVLQFAEDCQERGGLWRVTHVSSTFIAGDYDGILHEQQLSLGQTLATDYQRSKYLAERVVRGWGTQLPWIVCRLGMVVGDQHSGWILKPNPIYLGLKLVATGRVSEIPSDPMTPMDFITADYAADGIYHLTQRGRATETYHVVAAERGITIARFLDLVEGAFPGVTVRLVPPAPDVREMLAATMPSLTMKAWNDDTLARHVLGQVGVPRAPEFDERVFRNIAWYAVESDWGRQPMSRVEALRRRQPGG